MARSLDRLRRSRPLTGDRGRALAAAFRSACRRRVRAPLLRAVSLLFLLAFVAAAGDMVHFGGVGPDFHLQAPIAVVAAQYVLAIPVAFAAVAMVAGAVARDGATPATRPVDLFGRLAAGTLGALLCGCAALAGTLVGVSAPWLDTERLVPFSFWPYWHALWSVVAPNAFITSAVISAVAVRTGDVWATCAAGLALLLLVATVGLAAGPDIAALLDPLGTLAFAETIRHWTGVDRALMPGLSGGLLAHRLAWLGVGLASLALAAWNARTGSSARVGLPGRGRFAPNGGVYRQLAWPVAAECGSLFRSPSLRVVTALAAVYLFVWTWMLVAGGYVPPASPVGDLAGGLDGSALLPVRLGVVLLAGALVHGAGRRGENAAHGGVVAGRSVGAPAAALCCVVAALLTLGGVGGIAETLANPDAAVDLSVLPLAVYVVFGWELLVLAAVSVAVHAFAGSRLGGTMAMLLVLLWQAGAAGLGFEHVLYGLRLPQARYSQMNGYGHFVEPLVTVGVYWSAFAVLLGVCGYVLRPERGGAAIWFAAATQRCTPTVRSVAALAGVVWIGLGAWIFYNTNMLNAYETEADIGARRAEYERRFGAFADLPRPEPVAVDLIVDLYPERRALRSRGTVLLGNTGAAPITDFVVSFPRDLRVATLAVPATLVEQADALGIRRYAFDPPLRPTERVRMAFDVSREHVGFRHRAAPTGLAANGTLLAGRDVVPSMGYDATFELVDGHARRRHGLTPPEARADGRPGMFGGTRVRVRLGTSLDQVGVAPGRLVRAWREEDRSYFEYEADRLAWPFLWFRSARV